MAIPLVKTLNLTEFRNYRQLQLTSQAPLIVITGANGAGKTNLLEALSLLAPGRGLRRAVSSELQYQPAVNQTKIEQPAWQSGWAVSTVIATARGEMQIGTGIDSPPPINSDAENGETNSNKLGAFINAGEEKIAGDSKIASAGEIAGEGEIDEDGDSPVKSKSPQRLVSIDGTIFRSQSILNECLTVAWLTPQLDRLFLESGQVRRQWFDRLVATIQPDHSKQIAAYELAMRERGRLLRDGRLDLRWLAILEKTMAERSVAIAAARNSHLNGMQRLLLDLQNERFFSRPQIGIEGVVEAQLGLISGLELEGLVQAKLATNRQIDRETGTNRFGIHRSDFLAKDRVSGRPAAHCSTGEQKAMVLALFIAHARLIHEINGVPPLVLLDDLPAHFDQQHLMALHRTLATLGGQIWLTGTDLSDFHSLLPLAQNFKIEQGMVV